MATELTLSAGFHKYYFLINVSIAPTPILQLNTKLTNYVTKFVSNSLVVVYISQHNRGKRHSHNSRQVPLVEPETANPSGAPGFTPGF